MCQLAKLLATSALALAPASAFAQVGAIVTTGSMTREACQTLTVTASSAYAAGNQVGQKITLNPVWRSAEQGAPDQGGIVQSLRLTSKSVQTATFKAYQFQTNPTASTWTDKTTPSITGADIQKVHPPLTLSTADSSLGTMTVYGLDGIGRITTGAANQTDYWILITTGTPTFTTASDLQFCVTYLVD